MRSLFFISNFFTFCFVIAFACAAFAKPIKISQISDINFGTAGPGDLTKTVLPGTSETSTNASFSVTGNANTAYTITLPASGTMTTGNGANQDTISLSNFASFPAAGANGLLSAAGSQNLFVGATRASLRVNQKAGSYSGSFSVTVVY